MILICKICGHRSFDLTRHIRTHDIKINEYKIKFNEPILKIPKEKRPPKTSSYSLQHWLDKGYDLEEAKKQLNIRRPTTLEYYLNKGYDLEEAKELLKETKTCSLEKWQKKLGKEKGLKKWQDHIQKIKNRSSTGLQYWLDKGYTLEDAEKLRSLRQTTFTLGKCIEKYGEINGRKKWEDRQIRWQEKLKSKTKEELETINLKKISKTPEKFYHKYGDKFVEIFLEKNKIKSKEVKKFFIDNFLKIHDEFIKEIDKINNKNILRLICKSSLTRYKLGFNKNEMEIFYKSQLLRRQIKPGVKYGSIIKYKDLTLRSQSEFEIAKFLEDNNIEFKYNNYYIGNKGYKYDFYINKLNLYVEYLGLQGVHVEYDKKTKKKKDLCLKYSLNTLFTNDINYLKEYIWNNIKKLQ